MLGRHMPPGTVNLLHAGKPIPCPGVTTAFFRSCEACSCDASFALYMRRFFTASHSNAGRAYRTEVGRRERSLLTAVGLAVCISYVAGSSHNAVTRRSSRLHLLILPPSPRQPSSAPAGTSGRRYQRSLFSCESGRSAVDRPSPAFVVAQPQPYPSHLATRSAHTPSTSEATIAAASEKGGSSYREYSQLEQTRLRACQVLTSARQPNSPYQFPPAKPPKPPKTPRSPHAQH